ncbi:ArsR/SmtB family transcription factor [Rubrobacter indicoceani]|uniref:ArsR/SmtB family transcription factor n=1 Tax=Rubrobacter indicoceani TaxID=2051957 RepID=UPI000E5B2EA5|nr:metalloregulator ArsR/SmtB family transcription factor [Rubrobacter indicoceani]
MSEDRCDLLCIDAPAAEGIRDRLPGLRAADKAAERARALSDPTRLTLAVALTRAEELCVCDLAWISSRPQNLISHHMRSLKSAGLVESRRNGKMVMYGLSDEGRRLVSAVLGDAVVEGVSR